MLFYLVDVGCCYLVSVCFGFCGSCVSAGIVYVRIGSSFLLYVNNFDFVLFPFSCQIAVKWGIMLFLV